MYTFAIVAMLGLALWKTVGLVVGLLGKELSSTVRAVLTLGLGIVATQILDYGAFSSWGATFRDSSMDPVATGVAIGAMAYVWHHALGALEAYGRHRRDEARAIEGRAPRAA